ncbi:MAG: DUF748 domain-containing protein [Undibacterium sp.]|uniref:DUF748 domain-containing protein n=1 Tax=Undibacterium sp. TaxID=1914977 RepID=UPI00271B3804|nr:DUF748 domain-containing protein [Undibacterium sp.]MDO8652355.1 DUF748 domain-containing protein [Undibacterium sp.]
MSRFGLTQWQQSWQGRTRKFALGLLLITLFLILMSWLILPSYVKRLATEQVQQQLGRKLEITEISFSPLTLNLKASGVTLFEPDQKTPALSLKSAVLNLSLTSLWHAALVMDEIQLEQPVLHLVRTSVNGYGRYNFSDIVDRVVAMPKSAAPFLFSLANVQVQSGSIQFDDQVSGKQFQVDALSLGLPFVSNFPTSVNSFVLPQFSAKLNGRPFSLKGRSKPFIDSLDTALAIDIDQLDLASYIAYLPVPLPVQVESAKLTTKLDLVFSRKSHQSEFLLSGDVKLDVLSLLDKTAQPLLRVRSMQAHIKQLNLFNSAASIDALKIDAPEVWLGIDEKGQMNWSRLTSASRQQVNSQPPAEVKPTDKGPAPAISFDTLLLQQGVVHFTDALHATPTQTTQLSDIKLSIKQFSTAATSKRASFTLHAKAEQNQTLQFDGEFSPANGDVTGNLACDALQLQAYQGYLNRFLAATLSGRVALKSHVSVRQGQLKLDEAAIALDDFSITPKAKNEGGLAIKSLILDKLSMSTENRSVTAANLQVIELNADLRRDAQSRLNLQKLLLPVKASSISSGGAAQTTIQPEWNIGLQNFVLNGSSISFTDQAVSPAVTMKAEGISVSLDNLSSDMAQPVNMKWASTINRKGKLTFSGNATPQFKKITLNLDGQFLPVASLSPYFSHLLNIGLVRGTANAKGKLSISNVDGKPPVSSYEGMLSLNDFQIVENGETEDFLEWKAISLEGINASVGGAKQFVFLRKLALNDFYAKLILSQAGKLNLRNILVHDQTLAADVVTATTKTTTTATAIDSTTVATLTKPNAVAENPNPFSIQIAQTTLRGGNINFTDNFIRPNYKANLTGVGGSIGAISSDKPEAAMLELSGKIDNDAPLLISGTVNPLSSPIFVDIKGSANGIQLTRLSQYSAKYAGYAIEKGQLSVQMSYHVENQQLRAENQVMLDQLSFGERIDGPDATKLPVNLALALLRDNDGQIAINLPITGALTDPQFSVGGIIGKVFVNLITKAITSPFSLLSAAFGGGAELAYVEFAPGRAALTSDATSKLDSLVIALNKRPGLKLDITGRIDPKSDTEGLRKESLDKKIRSIKLRDLQKKNPEILPEALTIDDADRKGYMEEIYRAEKFAKPRNLIGIAKTLPQEEMMALILSNTVVTPEALRLLAQSRADIVRDYLEQKAGISQQRLFLIAPKLDSDDIKDKGVPNRVDFSLK